MITISGGGVFSRQNITDINANFTQLFGGFTPGNIIYLNPSASGVAAPDGSIGKPYTDLTSAYGAARPSMNDVVLLVGDGAAAGSIHLSAGFTWAKNATHLIGICPPGLSSQRARVSALATATAFANFFTVSASGCLFANVEFFHGFNTGTTAEICMTVTGSYNVFSRCHFAGMGDTTGAGDAGSRSLKIGSAGSGENLFEDCTVGLDTIARSAANASLELAGATPRNVFRRCEFPADATASSPFFILGTGADCLDRYTSFEDCNFLNALKSGGSAMTAAASLTNAAPGGLLVFKRCLVVGATKWGDTNALANSYIDMPAVSAAAGGLGINPS